MEPETWRWIWLALAAVFALGELAAPGSFFLLPFAIGAAVASALAFAGVPVAGELAVFLAVSVVALALFRKLAHRLDHEEPTAGIGSRRLIGQPARVIEAISSATDLGTIRVDREEWRAESGDGTPIPIDTPVKIVEVRGTRVVVFPVDPLTPPSSPTEPPSPTSDPPD